MADKEIRRRKNELTVELNEVGIRIRRYTLDSRLKEAKDTELDERLRRRADQAWAKWFDLWKRFQALSDSPTKQDLFDIESELLQVDREVDLIQRELITGEDFRAGVRTVIWLTLTLLALVALYFATHGVWSLDLATFEPFPEWGPMKYFEVAFWSAFGALCSLLFLATRYLTRRDFDHWYQAWYVSTLLRAPFLTVILMIIVLEFAEWYGEGTPIETYLLEEGNKFYFIVFVSFCLGLLSEETSGIIRQLAEGVVQFVRSIVGRFTDKLGSLLAPSSIPRK
jgi:hypothetical protein